mgnify:CR=1 FL=1
MIEGFDLFLAFLNFLSEFVSSVEILADISILSEFLDLVKLFFNFNELSIENFFLVFKFFRQF